MGFASRILGVGDRAPELKLRRLEGGQVALAELLPSAPVLLAFFKISCPVCQLTFPFLERIHQEAGGKLALYGISQDDEDATRDFNRRFGITFPSLLDTSKDRYRASNAFGISTVPSIFLVESDGAISGVQEGFSRGGLVALAGRAAVNPFRAGENVPEWKAG